MNIVELLPGADCVLNVLLGGDLSTLYRVKCLILGTLTSEDIDVRATSNFADRVGTSCFYHICRAAPSILCDVEDVSGLACTWLSSIQATCHNEILLSFGKCGTKCNSLDIHVRLGSLSPLSSQINPVELGYIVLNLCLLAQFLRGLPTYD